jgi:hypothetical protein
VWAQLPAAISTGLAVQARDRGLYLTPGPRFGADGLLERFLRLPFSLPPDQLVAAIAILAELTPRSQKRAAAGNSAVYVA